MKSNLFFILNSIILEKKLIFYFILTIVCLAILETTVIGSIYPLVDIVTNPEKLNDYFNIFNKYSFINLKINEFLILFFLTLFFLFLFSSFLSLLSLYQSSLLREKNSYVWRTNILNILFFEKKISFFEKSRIGDLIQRILLHTQEGSIIIYNICIFFKDFLILLFLYIFLFLLSPFYTLILSLTFLIIGTTLLLIAKKIITPVTTLRNNSQEEVFSILQNILSSIKIIKIFNSENTFYKKIDSNLLKFKNNEILLQTLSNSPSILLKFIVYVFIIFLVYLFSQNTFALNNSMLVVYIVGVYKIISSFGSLSNIYFEMSRLLPSVDIVKNQIYENKVNLNKEKSNKPIEIDFGSLKKEINFKKLNYFYNKNNKILNEVNFSINKSTFNLLLGPSGSGKTTLLDIISSFQAPESGFVSIDSDHLIDLNSIQFKNFCYVGNQGFVYPGSLEENITLFKPINLKKFEKVIQICELQKVYQEIKFRENNELSESGTNISSGQKQRISIARALYYGKKFLILDEPFSNVEPNLEKKLIKNLKVHCKENDITVIMTSHSSEPITFADNIFLLIDGKIVASGKHNELKTNNQFYNDNF